MPTFWNPFTFGDNAAVKRGRKAIPRVNALGTKLAELSDTALLEQAVAQRSRVGGHSQLDEELPEAFALVKEAVRRELGFGLHDVQLLGGYVMQQGQIAEMKTGEGKTVVVLLTAYLQSLGGTVHVVTANDYLAGRDAQLAARVLGRLGTTVGYVTPDVDSLPEKQAAYGQHIVYGTASEFGFDYLRDNTALAAGDVVQHGHTYVLIDEIDSVLIDEAGTPLILSAAAPAEPQQLHRFNAVAAQLHEGVHVDVDREDRSFSLTDEGWEEATRLLGFDLAATERSDDHARLRNAIEAHLLYRNGVDYVVEEGRVEIVDQNTGRLLPGRRWSWGLHQAIEAKENTDILADNRTIASVTVQHYFLRYEYRAGLTGTAKTDEAELSGIYGLNVAEIPTNLPVQRNDEPDVIWASLPAKHAAIVAEVQTMIDAGRPVLIGTVSINESEALSQRLDRANIDHEVLNANHHRREAAIIAKAGRPAAVTVATNMAGRGVDILLGGDPGHTGPEQFKTDRQQVLTAGGLHVIGCARNDSRRIDNQLRGRAGRQGEPGSSRFHLSLDDEMLVELAKGPIGMAAKLDRPLEGRTVAKAVERIQLRREEQRAKARTDMFHYSTVADIQCVHMFQLRRRRLDIADAGAARAVVRDNAMLAIDDLVARVGHDTAVGWAQQARSAVFNLWHSPLTVDELIVIGGGSQPEVTEALRADFERALTGRVAAVGEGVFSVIVRGITIRELDASWVDHLGELEQLREGMFLRGGSGDPKHQWGAEASELYEDMLIRSAQRATAYCMRGEVRPTPTKPDNEPEITGDGISAGPRPAVTVAVPTQD